ncbi:MAG TPA: hypothetical protein PKY59_25170, partial [Pyrinomonadaceae bacterium]|nr:hypothetical protein [Pyrinomonadaceae bacterium]
MKNNRSKMSFYGFLKNSGLVLFFAAAFVLVNSANAKAGAPFNDNFENAEILSGTRVSVRRTNLAATKQQFEQVHAGNVGGRSVWFKWTAPMTGYFSFSTNLTETNIDTLLHVYTGSQLNDLSNVGFNNNINSPANLKSYRILPVRSGTT